MSLWDTFSFKPLYTTSGKLQEEISIIHLYIEEVSSEPVCNMILEFSLLCILDKYISSCLGTIPCMSLTVERGSDSILNVFSQLLIH